MFFIMQRSGLCDFHALYVTQYKIQYILWNLAWVCSVFHGVIKGDFIDIPYDYVNDIGFISRYFGPNE